MELWEKGWLAAALEGEGSIFMIKAKSSKSRPTKRGYNWKVKMTICNTKEPFTNRAYEITKLGSICIKKRATEPWKKTLYEWHCSDRGIEIIIPEILPYLTIKRNLAELALEARNLIRNNMKYHDMRNDTRLEGIRIEMKNINKRRLKWDYQNPISPV